jgi:RHH-type proline utilization regulon transcriptional repressor/proline dehydrogenase/delta 1-pyrroline-5-carboxylate dehydrogenase
MSYALFADRFKHAEDKSLIVGQDNFLQFVHQKNMALRIDAKATNIDVFCSFAAILCCGTPVFFSFDPSHPLRSLIKPLYHACAWHKASSQKFLSLVKEGMFRKVRLLTPPDLLLFQAAASNLCYLATTPVLFNGRFELLHYVREVAISTDYHRYGNLNLREGEKRTPLQ